MAAFSMTATDLVEDRYVTASLRTLHAHWSVWTLRNNTRASKGEGSEFPDQSFYNTVTIYKRQLLEPLNLVNL